jgi:hypothetical protein
MSSAAILGALITRPHQGEFLARVMLQAVGRVAQRPDLAEGDALSIFGPAHSPRRDEGSLPEAPKSLCS